MTAQNSLNMGEWNQSLWGQTMKSTSHRKLVLGFSLFVSLALPAVAATPMVSAGLSHSMALTSEGKVLTWGSDNSGQLGIGRQTSFVTPQKVPAMNLGTSVTPVKLAAGTYHNAVVKADGTVWTWGDNLLGQLGDGSITAKSTPTQVPNFKQAVAVSAGFAFTMALKSDGTVWTWGSNSSGALGVGNNTDIGNISLTPVQVVGLDGFQAQSISAGYDFALAVINGYAIAWGANDAGQLGDGSDTPTLSAQFVLSSPTTLGPSNVVAVAAGVYHSMALDSSGGVWAWGNNVDGRLGDGTFSTRGYAFQIAGLPPIAAIAAGGQHSLALARDGTVWAWGNNDYFQLGVANSGNRATPAKVPGLNGITRIKTHYNHNMAIDGAGNVWSWGAGTTGQLGDGSSANRAAPVRIGSLAGVLAAEPGFGHTMAVTRDGQLYAWGESLAGQLGLTSDTDRTLPTTLTSLSNIVSVSGGFRHSLAAQSDGTVWAWGYNLLGQLGDGTADSRTRPTKVLGVAGITQVSAGIGHSVGHKSDGTVWVWGNNGQGQFGSGTTSLTGGATQVKNLTAVTLIAAGGNFTLALRNDGSVWTWGANKSGELGIDPGLTPSGYRALAARINSLPAMTAVAAGTAHSLALATDGTVWGWGDQSDGVLGNQRIDAGVAQPSQIAGLTDVVAIAAGTNHSMALRKDGSVYVWGLLFLEDDAYPIGTPQEFPGLGHVSSISAGLAHSVVAKSDGTVWSWGLNIEGGLGDGTYAYRPDSVAVINEQFSNLLDLNLAQPNFPVDPSKLPAFFAATQKLGSKKNTTLSVDLRGLLNPPAAPAGSKVRPNATRGYNIYVAAAVPNGTPQPLFFQLDGTKGWGNLVWPMGEYLRGVALDNQDSVVRAQILTDTDLSGLEGASIFVGYGLDANEMASSGRFRLIYKVPK